MVPGSGPSAAAKEARIPNLYAEEWGSLRLQLEEEFAKADYNADGKLSFNEFRQWAREAVTRQGQPDASDVPPTRGQLRALALQTMVPVRTLTHAATPSVT